MDRERTSCFTGFFCLEEELRGFPDVGDGVALSTMKELVTLFDGGFVSMISKLQLLFGLLCDLFDGQVLEIIEEQQDISLVC